MIAGHGDEAERGRARRDGGLALIEHHAPSTVIACLNAIRVNDREGVAATVPADVPVDDRRAGSNHRFDDGRTLVEALAEWGSGRVFDLALLAHRGDAHALVGLNLALREQDLSCLILASCRDDQVEHLTIFDPTDLGEAMYELGECWAAEQPPARAAVVRIGGSWVRAVLARDFETVDQLLAADFQIHDHRLSTMQDLDAGAGMDLLHAVLTDDDELMDLVTEIVGLNDTAILGWRTQATAGRLDEVDEELALLAVLGGEVAALEFFESSQLELAIRRLDEFGRLTSPSRPGAGARFSPPSEEGTVPSELITAATPDWVDSDLIVFQGNVPESVAALVAASRSGDRDALEHALSPTLDLSDRRGRTDTLMRTRAQVVSTLAAFGPNAFDVRLTALRGQALGLIRIMFERTEGGIADLVTLVEGANGVVERLELHDTAAFPDALASLSAAHLGLLAAEEQAALATTATVLKAIIDRRLEDLRSVLTDDFAYKDHRESMPLELGRDESVELLSSILEESPDQIDYAPEILRVTRAGLVTTRTQTTIDRLGQTDIDVVVMGVREGRLRAFEIFERVHADRAVRLLASWG